MDEYYVDECLRQKYPGETMQTIRQSEALARQQRREKAKNRPPKGPKDPSPTRGTDLCICDSGKPYGDCCGR
jgi:SEC-C motif